MPIGPDGTCVTQLSSINFARPCMSDGLIGVWCKHYLWCHPSGLIDLNEPLGSFTTWFMLHFFGACSKKDWYRIESGAWCKHQVVCGAWCMAQNNGTEFHLLLTGSSLAGRRAVVRLAFVAKKLDGTEKENKLAPSFPRCKSQCHFSQSKDFPINGRIS